MPAWRQNSGPTSSRSTLPFTLTRLVRDDWREARCPQWILCGTGKDPGGRVTVQISDNGDELVISGLDTGKYALTLQTAAFETKTTTIEVLRGQAKIWDKNPRFIVDQTENWKQNRICKLPKLRDVAVISEIRADRRLGVKVCVGQALRSPNTRIHLFGLRFLPSGDSSDIPAFGMITGPNCGRPAATMLRRALQTAGFRFDDATS